MPPPLAGLGALVLLGAWAAPEFTPTLGPLLLGVLGCCALAAAHPRGLAAALALGLAALLLGAAAARRDPPVPLATEGRVLGQVRLLSGHEAWVDSDAGPLVLRLPEGPRPAVGQAIAAWTHASRPPVQLPGEWARDAAARADARPTRAVRQWVGLGPAPPTVPWEPFAPLENGGLLYALVSGDRSRLSDSTLRLLARTGTRHLLAISGLHVGMVAGLAWALLRLLAAPLGLARWPRLSRLLPALGALLSAALYAQRVGWPVSTRRAVVMVGLCALARLLGRQISGWNLLGAAALALCLADPAQLRSPSFLLSFSAVAGMLALTPRLLRWLPPDLPRPLAWAAGSLAATLGAQAGTLSLTAWIFQELPPLAPLSNLGAAPLLGGLALPAALVGLALPEPLRAAALLLADLGASLAISLLTCLQRDPWTPAVGPAGALGLGLALLLRRYPVSAALLAAASLGLHLRIRPPTGELRATFLAIGQGDAALVELPDGGRWLVDGGPPSDAVLRWLRRKGIDRLDAVALSHPHPDHMGGLLPVLEGIDVGALWLPRRPEEGEVAFLALWQAAHRRAVPLRMPGDDPGPSVQLLHPLPGVALRGRARVNDESLVLRFVFDQISLLFPGDVEGRAEALLAPGLAPADVVKVPHHGSRTSSTRPFAAALRPRLAIFSCGPDSRFGHPHPQGLAGWQGAGWLRTDRDGTVEIRSDGKDLRVRTWTRDTGWRGRSPAPWLPLPPRSPDAVALDGRKQGANR